MTVRGRLDPGLEKPEEEREEGWMSRCQEREDRNPTQPEARRRTRPKDDATLATSTDLLFKGGHSEGKADLIFGQPTNVLIGV